MSQNFVVWLLIALALLSANLPFLTERVFAVFVWCKAGVPVAKPFWLRLLELLAFYAMVGVLGYAFESAIGNPFPQTWQFYVIALCLFLVLAYPGFVLRYLYRRSSRG